MRTILIELKVLDADTGQYQKITTTLIPKKYIHLFEIVEGLSTEIELYIQQLQ